MAFRSRLSALVSVIALSIPAGALAEGHLTADTVVATANGTDITLGHMIVLKQRLPEQYRQLPPDVLFEGILDQLVQQTLLGAEIESLSTGARLMLDNEERALRANEEIQRVARASITDEALATAYDEAFGAMEPETEFNASHILVETEDEAKSLIEELAGGADFAELAMEKSTGPSGPRGGQLGWFGQGAMVPPFEEAVMAMDVGAVSDPVQTQFGWHVIKLNETRVKDAPPLEQVRGQLLDEVQRKAIEAHVDQLADGAEITRKTVEDIDPALLDDLSLLEN